MTDQISSAVSVKIDSNTGVMTTISNSITTVSISGGNQLYPNTGMGQGVESEILGLSPVNEISLGGKVNTTTEAYFGPCVNGTSVTKTVQVGLISGQYLSGEANVGAVQFSAPIGLQTFTVSLRSSSTTGFSRTSVSL